MGWDASLGWGGDIDWNRWEYNMYMNKFMYIEWIIWNDWIVLYGSLWDIGHADYRIISSGWLFLEIKMWDIGMVIWRCFWIYGCPLLVGIGVSWRLISLQPMVSCQSTPIPQPPESRHWSLPAVPVAGDILLISHRHGTLIMQTRGIAIG